MVSLIFTGLIVSSIVVLTNAEPTYPDAVTTTPLYTDIEHSHQGVALSWFCRGGWGWAAAIGEQYEKHYTNCPWICNKHEALTKEHGYKSAGYVAVRSGTITAKGSEVVASAKVEIGNIVKWGATSQIRILIQIFDLDTGKGMGTPLIVTKSGEYNPSVRMPAVKGNNYQARVMVCAEVLKPRSLDKAEIAAVEYIKVKSITINAQELI